MPWPLARGRESWALPFLALGSQMARVGPCRAAKPTLGHCWLEQSMLATSSATVAGGFPFVLESGCRHSILQETAMSNKSFLGLEI